MYLRYDRKGRFNTVPMSIILLVEGLDRGLEVTEVYHFSVQLRILVLGVLLVFWCIIIHNT